MQSAGRDVGCPAAITFPGSTCTFHASYKELLDNQHAGSLLLQASSGSA